METAAICANIMLLFQAFLSCIFLFGFCVNAFNWDSIKYIYAFGDSYTFVQGTAGLANYSFIGDLQNLSFTPDELLSNQIIPKNTSSDGSNWIEFLTGCFGGSPLACEKQLWNFAFAGSDIDSALLPLHHIFTVPLVNQVQQWIQYASNVVPHPPSKTLTLWWIGINDTGDTASNTTITNFTAFWTLEMSSYFHAVQNAHDAGLHTHLFLNVPPEERNPATNGDATKAAMLKDNITLYNKDLAQFVANFTAKNTDATVMTFDANTWFNKVLDHPEEYGFTNSTGYCTCTDPGFFWYNTGHPTERVHRLLAHDINAMLKDVK